MSFTKDLAFGRMWEETAMSLVGGGEFAPPGRFKPFDFTSQGIKYEVKADRLAYKYGGNTMFVEFECSGEPSGISTTEADVWVYFMVKPDLSYKCYFVPVADLKTWCEGCVVKKGGDGWRARGYIVPVRTPPSVESSQALERTPSGSDLRIRLPPPPPLVPRAPPSPGNRTSPLSPPTEVLHG